jgi:hypothetical protein
MGLKAQSNEGFFTQRTPSFRKDGKEYISLNQYFVVIALCVCVLSVNFF